MAASGFTHLDPLGRARMVDVTAKEPTHRRAVARCRVYMESDTAAKIAQGAISKGDVLAVARVAGIQAAKQTSNLLPLCHPLLIAGVDIDFKEDPQPDRNGLCGITVSATVRTTGQTGVEMEAMTAVAVAALTIYDMCKAVDRGMVFTDICLVEKAGGKSGRYLRGEPG